MNGEFGKCGNPPRAQQRVRWFVPGFYGGGYTEGWILTRPWPTYYPPVRRLLFSSPLNWGKTTLKVGLVFPVFLCVYTCMWAKEGAKYYSKVVRVRACVCVWTYSHNIVCHICIYISLYIYVYITYYRPINLKRSMFSIIVTPCLCFYLIIIVM